MMMGQKCGATSLFGEHVSIGKDTYVHNPFEINRNSFKILVKRFLKSFSFQNFWNNFSLFLAAFGRKMVKAENNQIF